MSPLFRLPRQLLSRFAASRDGTADRPLHRLVSRRNLLGALPFALVQDNIKDWLSGFDGIAAHDTEALRGLVNGLLISGFAMQAHGNHVTGAPGRETAASQRRIVWA